MFTTPHVSRQQIATILDFVIKDDQGGGDRVLLQVTQQRVVKTFISPLTTVLQHDMRCSTKITNLNSYYNSDQSL